MESKIHKTAKLGARTKIGLYCVIMENAQVGAGSHIGNGVIIYPKVKVGKNAWIEDYAVLGRQPKGTKHTALSVKSVKPLKIGDNAVIGTQTVIYAGCTIGNNVYVSDGCIIRENNKIDDLVRLGKGVIFEHNAHLEEKVIVQANAIIGEYMVIEEGAFIGNTFSANVDKYMKMHEDRFNPPKIRKYARIGGNVTLVPGVEIGEYAVVGAGSVVTKNVEAKTIVVGNPARFLRKVDV